MPAEALLNGNRRNATAARGQDLETQQRWGEALADYEDAIRDYPDTSELWDRLTRGRMHYDLTRRYEDSSFMSWLQKLSEQDCAGGAFRSPAEDRFLLRQAAVLAGTDATRRGQPGHRPSSPAFRQANQIRGTDEVVQAFLRADPAADEGARPSTIKREACEVAGNVARLAEQELGLRPPATVLEFTSGAACALDQYSCFLTSGQLDEVFSQIEGNFVGLGIELRDTTSRC